MRAELLLLFLAVGMGNYLMRFLASPLGAPARRDGAWRAERRHGRLGRAADVREAVRPSGATGNIGAPRSREWGGASSHQSRVFADACEPPVTDESLAFLKLSTRGDVLLSRAPCYACPGTPTVPRAPGQRGI